MKWAGVEFNGHFHGFKVVDFELGCDFFTKLQHFDKTKLSFC